MTKADLIEKVLETAGDGYTKKQITELVDATFDALQAAIREGRYSHPGFGTFTVRERAAREGRNPQTGDKIKIAASKSVGFKPAPKFKGSL